MIKLERWRRKARFVDIAGRRIACWTSGEEEDERPCLLLLHGFPTSSWDWSAMWAGLEARFRLVALDMLGFGLSEKPRGIAYSILDQADLQEAMLERLGVGEAHLLAHDYGDTVAQELLARAREGALSFSVKSACLLNGGLFPDLHRARPAQKLALTPLGPLIGAFMTKAWLRRAFDAVYGPRTKPSDAEIDGHWALLREGGGVRVLHSLLNYIRERRRFERRWTDALLQASAPVRLIIGGADPVSGGHLYRYWLETAPNADAVLFDDIGHYPHTEAPEETLNAFFDFHRKIGTIAS